MRAHWYVEEVHPCGKKWKLYFAKEQYLQCNWQSTSYKDRNNGLGLWASKNVKLEVCKKCFSIKKIC